MSNSKAAAVAASSLVVDASLARQARIAAIAHLWLNRAVLGGIAVQFYTIILTMLGIGGFAAHAVLGWAMLIVAGLSLVSAGATRMPLSRLMLPAAVFALVVAQPLLALVSKAAFPAIYALHGANAVILLALAFRTERVAVRSRPAR